MTNSPAKILNIYGLGNNAIVYLAGLLVSNTLTLLVFPILAKNFSKSEFGLLDFYFSIGICITVLMAFGIDSSIGRLIHETKEYKSRSRLIFQSILIQSIFILTVVIIFYKNVDSILIFFKYDLNDLLLFKFIIVQAGFQAFINIALNLLKWTFQKWKYIFLSIISAGLGLICISIAIYIFNANLLEVVEAILISKILSTAIGIYLVYNLINYEILCFDYLARLLRYAIPIGIICILEVTLPVIERESILNFLSKEELGQYAASAKFVLILSVVVQAFQSAWGPFSLQVRNQELANEWFVLISKLFVFIISICSLVLLISGKFLLVFLTSLAYQDEWYLIFPMSISLIIYSIASITGIGLIISNRPYVQLLIYLIYLTISCILIVILTRQYGIFGAASAILISNIIRTIAISWISQCFYYINWPFGIIIILILINLISGLVIGVLMINSWYFFTFIFFIFWIICFSLYLWINALNNNEKKMISQNFIKIKFLNKY